MVREEMLFLGVLPLLLPIPALAADPPIDRLQVADGYKLNTYATDVEGARSLTLGKDGVVFVGTRGDKVYALLPDKNGDGRADGVKQIAEGLHSPNGVAYKNGDLYIAEISRIRVIRGVDKKLGNKNNKTEIWGPEFPSDEHHGWKFIAFGPDGWLYVPVGAPCNICEPDPNLYAAIHRVSPDGKKRELVAKGIRNTVGFDWDPSTKDLWFTDNGRDWMGDDVPPCELNHVTKIGAHYGFPACHGGVIDPEFGKGKSCDDFVAPVMKFPAHTAPLGMRFLKKKKNTILVAEHGSWNRTVPIGYKVTLVELKGDQAEPKPFVSGFLRGSSAWGRPVDVQEMSDGSILISDDKADAIYRVRAR